VAVGFAGIVGDGLMANVVIKLDTKELDKIAKGLDKNCDDVIGILAHQLEGYAKTNAPVDTGALKNSINTKRIKNNHWRVGDCVEYGIYQELGTSRMSAHPFMIPAAEKVAKDLNSGKTWKRIFE
jgi:HK97 gp10 family phage protein